MEKNKNDIKHYNAPDISILKDNKVDDKIYEINLSEIKQQAQKLKEVLKDLKINIKIKDYIIGPTISRIRFKLEKETCIKKLASKVDDIKLGRMRLLTPIPGTNLCGVEIPNKIRNDVSYKDVYLSEEHQKAIKKSTGLVFAIGKDIYGKSCSFDIIKAPHILIAGGSGSGKSVSIHVMLASLLCRYSPEDLRLILFDPKQVEFLPYTGIPHLLIPQILDKPNEAINALDWAIQEMERRYFIFMENKVRDIKSYNKKKVVIDNPALHLPYIVIVIEEFREITITKYKKQFYKKVQILAAKARAVGIHLVLSTQHITSHNTNKNTLDKVVTDNLKLNFPTRMAFAAPSYPESKIIINNKDASELIRYGDMLFMNPYDSELKRVQGAYLSTEDLEEIISYIKKNNESSFDRDVEDKILKK